MGTGTTGVVAKLTGRNYIGIDNSPSDVEYARKRIKAVDNIFGDNYIPRSKRMLTDKKTKTESVEESVFESK